MNQEKKLTLIPLVFLILGSMIGSGYSNLSADMPAQASAAGVLIGWLVTGVGMICLAMVYHNLSMRKPELQCGVTSYARDGFGDYVGFNSCWGYWVSAVCANASYFVIVFNALAYFFPSVFDPEIINVPAFIGGIIIIVCLQLLVSKGVKEASIVNVVVQVAKLLPILLFIIAMIAVFHWDQFTFDFFGKTNPEFGSILSQVKGTMLVTVWVFIGIEGAVVLSERAKVRKDVGKATIIALVSALLIYMLISLLTFGHMSGAEAAGLTPPAAAFILQGVVGPWGAVVINLGLIISVLGALLGWTILAAEVLFVGGEDGVVPKMFAKENKNGAPINALTITNILLLILLVLAYFSDAAYQVAYSISTTAILIPYLLSGMYGLKVAATGDTYDINPKGRSRDIVIGLISTIYGVWLVYAAGLSYLLLVAILYAIGIIMYAWVQKENNKKLFTKPWDIPIFVIITVAAIVAVVFMFTGRIEI